MNITLFDNFNRANLLPLAFTRNIADFRIGIFTISEKWQKFFNTKINHHSVDYLNQKFYKKDFKADFWVNSSLIPDKKLFDSISKLKENQVLVKENQIIAFSSQNTSLIDKLEKSNCEIQDNDLLSSETLINYADEVFQIKNLWDIFQENGKAIQLDFELLGKKGIEGDVKHATLIGENIYIHPTAKVTAAILNSESGPIYIGEGAEVMEGSVVRGPFALCDHAQLKLSTKIYGPTTIGPYSKVGGEVTNSILFGFSNKGHDGFLGNSVLGEWCNLGADTNNSNLKNNYSQIKLWNYKVRDYKNTGLQFCGLIMGDHSKSGINTMFNTGTVVGVSANIFGGGFPSKFIPSFSWGGSDGLEPFNINKAIEVAQKVMERRNHQLSEIDIEIFKKILEKENK
jgi:UDP-N-acetylglucosamine diphosphorylase/glucosamine-1-phosphate N-acetyltransferase